LPDIDIPRVLMFVFSFIVSVTIHEFSHAFAADRLGDDLPRRQGRITINPLDHLTVWGTLVLVVTACFGFGFGWGKPVEIQPDRFRHPRLGDAIVSLAGPISNLVLAGVLAVVIRNQYCRLPMTSPYIELIDVAFQLNVVLFAFNLVPIPPLDGSHILTDILPPPMADGYKSLMAMFGWVLFALFLWYGIYLIAPVVTHIEDVLVNACIL
jgi:Zn-dependent protease